MYSRSKVLAIESIIVMLVLILFAFVVFVVIDAGTNAYDNILEEKQDSESARVAYSYINMKIKQNDAAGCIGVVETAFGHTLKIDLAGTAFSTYIFFSDGTLYECLTKQAAQPSVGAANRITDMDGFDIYLENDRIHIKCICENGGDQLITEGTVGLRS
ncbi:MAG: DUF4860 domain-containing protein [Eubacteriales bacterium]|nr:DUF4860 domain-containing protein [Eubacteriales bacterium]